LRLGRWVQANHELLTQLYAAGEPDLEIACAHDPTLLHRAQSRD